MKPTTTYLLAAHVVVLGMLACIGWLYIGHTDDAPGAGLIGFASLLSAMFAAFRIVRGKRYAG